MGKIIFPPQPKKGQTIYKHKTELVMMGGKQVPRYIIIDDRNIKKLPKDYLKEFTIYQRFGQAQPGVKKVEQPPVPKTNKPDAKNKVQKQEESQGVGTDGKGAVGETEVVNKGQDGAGEGDTGSGGETTSEADKTTKTKKATPKRRKRKGGGNGEPTVTE